MDLAEVLAEINAADQLLTEAKAKDGTALASKTAADAAAAQATSDSDAATAAHVTAKTAAEKAIADLQAYFGTTPVPGPALAMRRAGR